MRRIKKCLALSASDNEHEAALALRHAQKLMREHGIKMEEAQQPEVAVVDLSEGKRARCQMLEHELYLHSMVGEFFGCEVFLRDRWPVFVGQAPGPQIAEYAVGTLLRQLRSARKDALADIKAAAGPGRRLKQSSTREFNHAFGSAWVYAVSQKVQDFAQGVSPAESELYTRAFFGDKPVVTHTPRKRNLRGDSLATYAAHAGFGAGSQAELNHGVAAEQRQQRICDTGNS